MAKRTIKLNRIRTDGGTQMRAEINMDVVFQYKDDMDGGATFPPVDVFYDGTEYWLADGFHRFYAVRENTNGDGSIQCVVHRGTVRDAILFAVGANAAHGLRRTNKDKRQAVEALLRDPKWSIWSDRTIAKKAGVSQVFVSRLRSDKTANLGGACDNGYHDDPQDEGDEPEEVDSPDDVQNNEDNDEAEDDTSGDSDSGNSNSGSCYVAELIKLWNRADDLGRVAMRAYWQEHYA